MNNTKNNIKDNENKANKKNSLILKIVAIIIIISLALFDQWTKLLAVEHLMGNKPIVILEGIFELLYVENRGAAFGMLSGGVDFFVIITCILVPIMIYMICKIDSIVKTFGDKVNVKAYRILQIDFIFLIAGALGNFVDRILNGFVVDFFYFKLIDFPVFNVADIYVTLSTIVLLIILFFVFKERELDYLIGFKKKWAHISEKTYDDEKKKGSTNDNINENDNDNNADTQQNLDITEE